MAQSIGAKREASRRRSSLSPARHAARLSRQHRQRLVALELVGDGLERQHRRRVGAEPSLAVDVHGELGQCLQVVVRARPVGELLDDEAVAAIDAELAHDVGRPDRELLGPDLERPHLGEARHRLPIGAHRPRGDRLAVGRAEAPPLRRHGEAGGEALHVPLPRSRQRLVEVVHVEHEAALGRGVGAEVREVRVAAGLYLDAGRGRAGEVARHHHCRAAEEREGRGGHPSTSHRDEPAEAVPVLLLELLDRIRTVGARRPVAVGGAWGTLSGRPTPPLALGDRPVAAPGAVEGRDLGAERGRAGGRCGELVALGRPARPHGRSQVRRRGRLGRSGHRGLLGPRRP